MRTVMGEKRWARKYPDLGTAPIPVEPYVSPRRFALERDRIFRRTWINVGLTEEVPEPGDYFVREIAVCDASILIIRGSDGVVRGFHNVCSHRGKQVALDERGSCPGKLYCRYHHWVYSDTGALVHVPDEENFFALDKGDLGLTPVNTDVWQGFIFVHLDPDPAESLRDYLGGVAEQLEGCPFQELRLRSVHEINLRANWKVIQNGQNEAYHFPFRHRRTLGGAFVANEKGFCRYQDVHLYNYHSVWSVEYKPFQRLTPLRIALAPREAEESAFRIPQMIGNVDHYVLFPNFVILLVQIGNSATCITYNLWPVAVDRTIWEIRMHFTEPASLRERLRQEHFRRVNLDTLQEDAFAHEHVYAGLVSRAKSHLILQDEEVALRFFHRVVEDFAGRDRRE